ncbi:muskelin [Prorops nasuta]|uniref:muskelin n=1 Tax=Prorops nasuta TaxID=863751 RepID=UPI0034CEF42C
MASNEDDQVQKNIEYRIYNYSSYQFSYIPENILVDKPKDQTSRWSSENNNQPQYVTLKLLFPSIVKTITFGKYKNTHVCNIKRFRLYGGLEPENMMELLESGLKNDSKPETFELKHMIGNGPNYFPVKYIKIVPFLSWGPQFDFSIWHVHFNGIIDPKIVKPSIRWINTYRQKEVIRLCMKHFRKLEQHEIVDTLKSVTGVPLEDPQLSVLYELLVEKGDHQQTEDFITNAVVSGLLNDYINAQSYKTRWTKLQTNSPKPGMRGGHQMILDANAGNLYLFGGWNGNQDLADFWSYNISEDKWTLLSKNTETIGGPSARSCHKMCLDPVRKQLFTLGRFLDNHRTAKNVKSDFYVYDIESEKWTQITDDTAAVGGPPLIYDHQICMDVERRTIYVFGGRYSITPSNLDDGTASISTETIFSGLYSYHVPSGTWNKLLVCDIATPSTYEMPVIKSRAGHSMLFHPVSRKLYVFAGQRGKEHLNDFFSYEVDTHQIEYINPNELNQKDSNVLPAAGFTQRATIDPELDEIYVLSGLRRDKDKREDNVQNSFWVYNIRYDKWSCIYRNENVGDMYWRKMQDYEPCPRFAHQLVYDHIRKIHYLFGGNPGRSCLPNLRLDDFWQMKLCRPSHEQILRRCKLLIRKYRFEELALNNCMAALEYLQTEVSEMIDHNDEEQTKEFQLLTSSLFRESTSLQDEDSADSSQILLNTFVGTSGQYTRNTHTLRTELYDKLTEFFPESLTQPRANLIDLVPL